MSRILCTYFDFLRRRKYTSSRPEMILRVLLLLAICYCKSAFTVMELRRLRNFKFRKYNYRSYTRNVLNNYW